MKQQWRPVEGHSFQDIRYEKSFVGDRPEGIAKITIARPEVRNAFRPLTVQEMERAFRGKRITIRVQNPERKCKGVKQLIVGGKAMQGNLLPIEALKDGLVVEAKLEG